MKNKYISFILCILITFVPLTVSSDEMTVNEADEHYEIAHGLIKALNSDFSISKEDEKVTRAEFIKNLVGILNAEITDGTGLYFKDINKENQYAPYIKFALSHGWVNGGEYFYPDDAITLEQAVKIGVTATGHGFLAESRGGYPVGYLQTAKQNSLIKNLSKETSGLSARDACVLIFNIVNADIMEVVSFGDDLKAETRKNKSLLSLFLNIYSVKGVLSANQHTNMHDGSHSPRKGKVVIANQEFYTDNEPDLLGYNVWVFYKAENDRNTVVYMSPYRNNVVKINNRQIADIENLHITAINSDVSEITLDNGFSCIYNGKAKLILGNELESILTGASSNFTFIDNNNDDIYDVLAADSFKYTYVASVDTFSNIIYDSYSPDNTIDLSGDDCSYSVECITNGEIFPASLSEIVSGDIVAFAASDDKKLIRLIICYDSIKGTAEAVSNQDGKVEIDGNSYFLSEYFSENFEFNLAYEGTFYLGINNEIVVGITPQTSMLYGWIIAIEKQKGLDGEFRAKLFSQSGAVSVYPLANSVILDGTKSSAKEAKDYIDTLTAAEDRLLKYSVDETGHIKIIDTASHKIGDLVSMSEKTAFNDSLALHFAGTYKYRPASKTFGEAFNISRTSYYFSIPSESERDDDGQYHLLKQSYYENDKSYTVYAYDVDLGGCAKVVLLVGVGGETAYNSSQRGIVEKITYALDEDGNSTKALHIWSNYSYLKIYADKSAVYTTDIDEIKPGDIIHYTTNSRNTITDILKAFDFQNYVVDASYITKDGKTEYNIGYAYSQFNNYMYIFDPDFTNRRKPKVPAAIDYTTVKNINIDSSKIVFVNAVRSSDGSEIIRVSVRSEPISNIVTYLSGGSKANLVVCQKSYSTNYMAYVYQITYQ